jgi:homoserine kinase
MPKVRVPASSANLGPGFDALGLALGIYLECRFRPSDRLVIRASGRDAAQISTGEDNLIWQTALAVARDTDSPALPPIELEIQNEIPLGKGLGSSAAALTAGVVIADHLLGLNWKPTLAALRVPCAWNSPQSSGSPSWCRTSFSPRSRLGPFCRIPIAGPTRCSTSSAARC